MQSQGSESVKQKTVMRTLEVVAVELSEVMAIRAVAAAKLAEIEAREKSLRAEITSNLEAQVLIPLLLDDPLWVLKTFLSWKFYLQS